MFRSFNSEDISILLNLKYIQIEQFKMLSNWTMYGSFILLIFMFITSYVQIIMAWTWFSTYE